MASDSPWGGGSIEEPAPDAATSDSAVLPPGWVPPPPGTAPVSPSESPYGEPGGYPPVAPAYPAQPAAPAYPPPGYPPAPPMPPYAAPPGYSQPPAGPPPAWPPPGFVAHPVEPPKKKKSTAARVVLVLFLVIVVAGFAGVIIAAVKTPSPGSAEGIERVIAEIERDVADLRQLQWKEPVKKRILTKEELAERVREEIKKEQAETSPTARGSEDLFKFMHLIPQSMDLMRFTEELFSSDVLGYYDTETKEIVVGAPSGKVDPFSKTILAHELVHAIEDQHFDFEKIEKRLEAAGDGEAEAAFTAVVEGSATLAMRVYAFDYLPSSELREIQQGNGNDDSAVDQAPRLIKEAILFPYEAGQEFVEDFQLSGGWDAVDKLYSDLPINTEQIMYPDRYEAGEVPPPISVADATPTASAACELVDMGALGARDMEVTLRELATKKQAAVAETGWNGDAYRFDRCGSSRLFQLKVRGDEVTDTKMLREAWDSYVTAWSEGKGEYSPKPAPGGRLGSGLVREKNGYVAVAISDDPALASAAMTSL